MKKTILIAKGGSVYRTRALASTAPPTGEQGETEGLIRHLLIRDDINLVYFGKYRGEVPKGLTVVDSELVNVKSNFTLAKDQEIGFRIDIDAIEDFEPIAFIQTAGYSPTMSMIDNPRGATVQCAAINYTAPMLNIIEHFKLPRLVVNCDPRTYPRDQEMSMGWPYCRPAALLDQCYKTISKVVGSKKYTVRSVHARPESWGYHVRSSNTDENDCVIVAHAHIKDGCKQKMRGVSWHNVLDGSDYKVYGKGWEHYEGYNEDQFPGCIPPNEVYEKIRTHSFTPCVSAGHGFYTGKVYVAESQGCIPILYGDGSDPYTWDPLGLFIPLNSEIRIRKPGDLGRIIRMQSGHLKEVRALWRERCRPHWNVLDNMINDLLSGLDIKSPEWFELYGGYK